MVKKCQNCKKEFRTYPSRRGMFCSKECYEHDHQKGAVDLVCVICEKDFRVPSHRKKATCCSFKCSRVLVGMKNRGNKHATGHLPWNKGLKGIHLNPACEFKKGNRPWNKSIKGIRLSPESEFKKGLIPINKVPVGSVKFRTGHDGKRRKWIKVDEPNKWMCHSRFVYQRAIGDLVNGMVIHHLDGNTLNDDPDNLEQLTKAEHMEVHRSQLELAKIG